MRALFVHGASDLYGSDLAMLAVAEEAMGRGWVVDVTVPYDGPLVERLEAAGCTVLHADPLKPRRADLRARALPETALRWARNSRNLRRLASEQRYDLVYTTTAPTLGGSLVARRQDCRHVYHVHEIFWFPRPLVAAFERVLGAAEVVACCSGAVRDQFSEPIRQRCVVAHTGSEVPEGLTEVVPFDRARPRLVCVARLNEWKGQEVLVDAVALLRDRGVDVDVDLVGGVYRDVTAHRDEVKRRIAAASLGDRVHLLGERRDAAQLMAAADALVLPSRRPEPFGMVLVEAMALGRPVVATADGGPLEIVTDGVDGLLVTPGDAAALADGIERLVHDPALARRLGAAARPKAATFSIRAMARTVVDTFEASTSPV